MFCFAIYLNSCSCTLNNLSIDLFIFILKTQLFFVFVCLSRINRRAHMTYRSENLHAGVILHADKDQLVL